MTHTWEPPPPPPPPIVAVASTGLKISMPLLLLLPLLLFRPNRAAEAWWIWLPIVIAAVAVAGVVALLIDEDISLLQAVHAYLIGLAAVWLLTPYLKSRYRIVMFLKTVPVLAAFSLLAYVPTLLGDKAGWLDFRPFLAGLLALASLAGTLTLTLAGLAVRRRFGRIRFLFWLAIWTVLAWTAIAAPFAVFALLGSAPEWGEFAIAVLVVSGVMLLLLLPLVLLSFFQPFYRTRLADWLNLPQPDTTDGISIPPLLPGMAQIPTAAASAKPDG